MRLVFKLDDWFWMIVVKSIEALAMGLFFVVPGIFLAGSCALIYQGVVWLRHGTWEPIMVVDAVGELLPATFFSWLMQPTDWIGLSKLMTYALTCSLWWVLLVLGVLLAYPLFYCAVVISDAASRLSRSTGTIAPAVTSET